MNLKYMSDKQLLDQTQSRVSEERERLTDLLHHFCEINRRRLFSAQKSPSMYAFLMSEYKYSKDQAYRRITAMRLIQELPEVEEKLNSGELNLSIIVATHAHVKNEEKFSEQKMTREQKMNVVEQVCNKSVDEAARILVSIATAPPMPKPDTIKEVINDQIELCFAADRRVLAKIEKLKGLLAHQNPNLSMGELFDRLCDLGLESLDKSRTKTQKKSSHKPETAASTFATSRKSTPSKAAIRRQVFEQADNKCQNCDSAYAVEEDHVIPRAQGGSSEPENLRLLCRSCNQRAAIEKLGQLVMDPFINPQRVH